MARVEGMLRLACTGEAILIILPAVLKFGVTIEYTRHRRVGETLKETTKTSHSLILPIDVAIMILLAAQINTSSVVNVTRRESAAIQGIGRFPDSVFHRRKDYLICLVNKID
ncbi:hypothetical protein ACJ72_03969 [Emergomyces africanus]|uniref:Uncharacterized protein n=1 Tax=Emergomyces africanus TaxID=1955775 RepID=A0A1B7NY36_9EURO|nr:hypothetical protein ACJ72_03969 [Emergomyces africanus]